MENSTLQSSFDEWKAARIQLSTALQSYLSTCTSLQAACDTPTFRSSCDTATKFIVEGMDSEFESLHLEEKELHDTRVSLLQTRNCSPALARINSLPPEVLANIFSFSRTYCVHDFYPYPYSENLTAVCRYWRRVASDAPNLWNHIDIGPYISRDLTKRLVERASEGNVYLHFYEPNSFQKLEFTATASTLLEPILTCIPRVSGILIESHHHSRNLVAALLNCWLVRVGQNQTKSLLVYRSAAAHTLKPEDHGGYLERYSLTDQSSQDSLLALTKLHLQNTVFGWDSSAYRGLVDLQLNLSCSSVFVSPHQLANILAASPSLVVLKLCSVHIVLPEDDVPPAPVRMNCLRSLGLFNLGDAGLKLLLPLIRLPSSPIELGIKLWDFNVVQNEMAVFLENADVTMLYWESPETYSPSSWLEFRKLLPNLCYLIITDFSQHFMYLDGSSDCGLSLPHAQLDTIVFRSSLVTLDGLKFFVGAWNPRRLHIESCNISSTDEESAQQLEDRLWEAYPSLDVDFPDSYSNLERSVVFGGE